MADAQRVNIGKQFRPTVPMDSQAAFSACLAAVQGARHAREVSEAVDLWLIRTGFSAFGYMTLTPRLTYCGTFADESVRTYIEDGWWQHDPHVIETRGTPLPVLWSLDDLGSVPWPLAQLRRRFGYRSGAFIRSTDAMGRTGVVAFFGSFTKQSLGIAMEQYGAKLHYLSSHIHDVIVRLTGTGGEELSPKGRACLALAAQGMSNKQIARLIQITDRGVKWHLDNVRKKLAAANRIEAIAIAKARGLI